MNNVLCFWFGDLQLYSFRDRPRVICLGLVSVLFVFGLFCIFVCSFFLCFCVLLVAQSEQRPGGSSNKRLKKE